MAMNSDNFSQTEQQRTLCRNSMTWINLVQLCQGTLYPFFQPGDLLSFFHISFPPYFSENFPLQSHSRFSLVFFLYFIASLTQRALKTPLPLHPYIIQVGGGGHSVKFFQVLKVVLCFFSSWFLSVIHSLSSHITVFLSAYFFYIPSFFEIHT